MAATAEDNFGTLAVRHRRRWLGIGTLAAVAIFVGSVGIASRFDPVLAGRWFAGAALVYCLLAGWVWHILSTNPDGSGGFRATIGPPTMITAGRGLCVALLAGFVLLPTSALGQGWLVWVLYTLVAAGDAIDGAVARARNSVTELGTRFDTEVDALGILIASILGVTAGWIPVWYLAAGGFRYVFVFGIALRRFRGLGVAPLPPRRSRRWLAGLQMAFIVVALAPPTGPTLVTVLGAIVLVPFGLGFARDWGYVTGRIAARHPTPRAVDGLETD